MARLTFLTSAHMMRFIGSKKTKMNERLLRPPFDNFWRERLRDYPKSEEFKKLFTELKEELPLPERKLEIPIVVSLMGVTGSGKSTFSQALQEFVPALHLRTDIVGLFRLPKAPNDDYYKAYVIQEALARHFLGEGYSVIMDDNNRTRYNREQVYKLAQGYNARNALFQLSVPIEVAAARANTRDTEEGRSSGGITLEETKKLVQGFQQQIEEPTVEELKDYDVFYRKLDASQPISTMIGYLRKDSEFQKLLA